MVHEIISTTIHNGDDLLDLSDDNIVHVAFFFVEYPKVSMRPRCYENAPFSESFWAIEYPGPGIIRSGQRRVTGLGAYERFYRLNHRECRWYSRRRWSSRDRVFGWYAYFCNNSHLIRTFLGDETFFNP